MKRGYEFKAGLFVVIGLIVFVVAVFWLGRERQIFADQQPFMLEYRDVKGLAKGAPVRMGGLTIGRVENLRFSEEGNGEARVIVKILINEEYLARIRTDTVASLETVGLLGDRFVSLSLGKAGVLSPESKLVSVEVQDVGEIVAKATSVMDNVVELSEQLNAMVTDVRGSSKETFGEILKSVDTLLTEVRTGDGVVHALIYEPGGKKLVDELSAAAAEIAKSSAEIGKVALRVETGPGFLHEVVYGKPREISDLLDSLRATVENMKRASEALSGGTGTLGALLVDAKLYDNLVEVTDGAKRSFILRQLIRNSLDKKPDSGAKTQPRR